MGQILNSKRCEKGVALKVLIPYDEAICLKGHYDNIHIFSEKAADFKTIISSRGRNSTTKYFLIPKCYRKKLNCKAPIGCQKIQTADKIIFIYVVDKFGGILGG